MTEVKEMYKLACFIDSDKYAPTRTDFKEPKTAIEDCAKRYAETKRQLSLRKASSILDNTIAHKYIEVIGDTPTGHTLRVTSGRGRQLVAKTWVLYRKGLREQTMKEYPRTMAMYKVKYVARVGAIGTIIGVVGGIILGHFWH